MYFISLTLDNASVNDVIVATIGRFLLTKYGIPESPNQHIRCLCHVVNLVVQSILAVLGEADDPRNNDHFLLNKAQPLHLDIDNDLDQVALDHEEFDDVDNDIEESVGVEDEEKLSTMQSPLSKVCFHLLYRLIVLKITLCCVSSVLSQKKTLYHIKSSTVEKKLAVCNGEIPKGGR